MTLKPKIFLIIAITAIILIGVITLASTLIIQNNFSSIEDESVRDDLALVNNVIHDKMISLERTNSDWSAWDDTYIFMQDHNQSYINSNLGNATFTSLQLNLLAYIDISGEPVWVQAFDLETGEITSVTPDIYTALADRRVTGISSPDQILYGVFSSHTNPMLFTAGPIVNSRGEGPIHGTLVMGQYIDANYVAELAAVTQFDITSLSADSPEVTAVFENLSNSTSGDYLAVQPVNDNLINGYLPISDIHGRTALVIKTASTRPIFMKSKNLIFMTHFWLTAITAIFVLVIMAFLEKTVTSRLQRLTRSVTKIGKSEFQALPAAGKDELAVLAREVNTMVFRLTVSQEALAISEKKYATLVEQNNDGIVIVKNNVIYYANSVMETMLGVPLQDIIGHPYDEFITPSHVQMVAANYHARMSRLEVMHRYEVNLLCRDGTEISTELSGKLIEINGEPCDMVVIRDITARKQAEAQLNLQKELLSCILDRTPNAVFVVDTEGQVTLANPASGNLMKTASSGLNGLQIRQLMPDKQFCESLDQVIKGQKTAIELEFIHNPADTGRIIKANIVNMNSGNVLLILSDITKEREQQEKLFLSNRLVSIGEMASGIAHELNNPLTSIIGLSQLLLEDHLSPENKEDISGIYNEAQRAAAVVKNLLTFARKHPREKQIIQLNKVIEDVLKLRAYEHSVNNISVIADLDSGLPEINADYHQMQQVFLNIVLNAESAMIEANHQGLLTITTQQSGDWIRITFQDNGPGITEQNIKYIFDPFFTTKDVGKGTGLGLSICYGIIRSHSGRIYARSEYGKGAAFCIELPLHDSKIEDEQNGDKH